MRQEELIAELARVAKANLGKQFAACQLPGSDSMNWLAAGGIDLEQIMRSCLERLDELGLEIVQKPQVVERVPFRD
jgi:hypothetical protein